MSCAAQPATSSGAFHEAIAAGVLSEDLTSPVYAGAFLHMGCVRGVPRFKHRETRYYLSPDGSMFEALDGGEMLTHDQHQQALVGLLREREHLYGVDRARTITPACFEHLLSPAPAIRVTIRSLSVREGRRCMAVVDEAAPGYGFDFELAVETYAQATAQFQGMPLVAEADHTVVGVAILTTSPMSSRCIQLSWLHVSPAFAGRGVDESLMRAAAEYVQQRGSTLLFVSGPRSDCERVPSTRVSLASNELLHICSPWEPDANARTCP